MAKPFDASVFTKTRSHLGPKDNTPATLGALNSKGMIQESGLGGTTGTDVKLIHGDRWQQIKGNQIENIEEDLTTHILKNEKWTIDENLTYKVSGKTVDTRVEDFKEYFYAETLSEYTLEHVEKHHDKDHQINPTHNFDFINVEGEWKTMELSAIGSVFEAKGTVVGVAGAKAEAWGASAEAWGLAVGAGHFSNEAVAIDIGERALKAEILETCGHMIAAQAQVGATRVIIMPVRVGICIAVHIDSPVA